MENEKIIDLNTLKEFTNGKEKLILSTINLLIEEIPKDVALMEEALQAKDWEKLRSVAHRTKPNFMLVAKEVLKKDILAIEEYAREQINLDQLSDLLQKVKDRLPTLTEGLQKEVERLEANVE